MRPPWRLWAYGLLCGLLGAHCAAPAPPAEAVGAALIDPVGLLSPDETRRLRDSLTAYHQATGVAYFLYIVPSLEGRAIEAVALERSAEVPAGTLGLNNSAGIYLAPTERAIKIEAGRGLEWQVPDSFSYALLDKIRPRLAEGAYAEAFHQAYAALHAQARQVPWDVAFTDLADWRAAGPVPPHSILRLYARALPRDFGQGYMTRQFDPELYLDLLTPAGDTLRTRFTRYMLDPVDLTGDRWANWYLRTSPEAGAPLRLLGIERGAMTE